MGTPSLQEQIREARRHKGLTQAGLARQAGCTQSALSMFESGQESALATETLQKITGLLGIEVADSPATPPVFARKLFCPNFQCPPAFPYFAGTGFFIRPLFFEDARHCPHCGEILLDACPHCGAVPAGEKLGACCATCGKRLVLATLAAGVSPRGWVREHRAERTLHLNPGQ